MTEDRNGVPEDAGEEVWVDRDWPRLVVGGLYMILGVASGLFYREFTKWNGFTGRTALGFLHPHLLMLGAFLLLIVALFTFHLPLLENR